MGDRGLWSGVKRGGRGRGRGRGGDGSWSSEAAAAKLALARFNPDGSPDTSFDGDGRLLSDVPSVGSFNGGLFPVPVARLALDAGWVVVADGGSFTRYDASGLRDPLFGGALANPFASPADTVAAIDPTGGVVVAGTTVGGAYAAARYDVGGARDMGFGTAGLAVTGFARTGAVRAVAVAADGRVVAAGTVRGAVVDPAAGPTTDLGVVVYEAGGAPAAAVALPVSPSLPNWATAVVARPDGTLLVAGGATLGIAGPTYQAATLARYNPDGTPDETFGAGGTVIETFGTTGADYVLGASDLAVDSQDRLVVVALVNFYATMDDGPTAVVARYLSDGSRDTAFGGDRDGDGVKDGWLVGPVLSVGSTPAVVVDGSDRILVAGGADGDFVVARYAAGRQPRHGVRDRRSGDRRFRGVRCRGRRRAGRRRSHRRGGSVPVGRGAPVGGRPPH